MLAVLRRAFNFACVVSFALCLALIAFTWRTSYRSYHFHYMDTDGTGQMHFIDGQFLGLRRYDDPWFLPASNPNLGWRLFTTASGQGYASSQRYWVSRDAAGWIIHWPLWTIAAAAGVLPGIWIGRRIRAQLRPGAGFCAACGYDLRASPQRCPECGTFATAAAMTSSVVKEH
jgi:hypothetical protein